MTLFETLNLTEKILALTLIMNGFEILKLSLSPSVMSIWSYKNLQSDLEQGLPFFRRAIEFVFADQSLKWICGLQIITSFILLFNPFFEGFIILFFTHLIICIRFRGTFNGGSDMMIFILLTGLMIANSSQHEGLQKLGLIYISIHLVYSYFKAGLVKILQPAWRRGQALPAFLNRSLYADMRRLSYDLGKRRNLARLLCWVALLFELSALVFVFQSRQLPLFFAVAVSFHFLNFIAFGLNRFLWIWLSAWPSLFYVASLIR
jgi:hypothetical protein